MTQPHPRRKRTIREGERVRITAQSDTGIYIVRAVSGDTLTVQLPSSQAFIYFPFTSLKKVEVSGEPEALHKQPLRYGLLAGIGSGLAGGLVGYWEVKGDTTASKSDKIGFARNVGWAFALIGFGGGFVSGLINRGERWERVPLPPRVSAIVRDDGVFALSYSF